MGSAATRPYLAGSADIRLEYGIAQTFALKFPAGKQVESRFPGGRVMFTAIDDRRLFLDDEDASDLERTMRELGIGPSDFMRVTKVRHPRGGGHSIRVERVEDADPDTRHAARIPAQPAPAASRPAPPAPMWPPRTSQPSREEALLEKSVEMARESGAAAFVTSRTEQPIAVTPAAAQMAAAMCAAVDSILETQAYALRRGLGLTFSSEDVRAVALTIFIQNSKGGAR